MIGNWQEITEKIWKLSVLNTSARLRPHVVTFIGSEVATTRTYNPYNPREFTAWGAHGSAASAQGRNTAHSQDQGRGFKVRASPPPARAQGIQSQGLRIAKGWIIQIDPCPPPLLLLTPALQDASLTESPPSEYPSQALLLFIYFSLFNTGKGSPRWFPVIWIHKLKPLPKTSGHMVSSVRAAHHIQTLPETRKEGSLPNSLHKANINLTSSPNKEIKRKRRPVSLANTDKNISKQEISELNLGTHERGQCIATRGGYCSNVHVVKQVWTPPIDSP